MFFPQGTSRQDRGRLAARDGRPAGVPTGRSGECSYRAERKSCAGGLRPPGPRGGLRPEPSTRQVVTHTDTPASTSEILVVVFDQTRAAGARAQEEKHSKTSAYAEIEHVFPDLIELILSELRM